MKAVHRHARHLSLARAERAAGLAFGFAEDEVAAAPVGFGRGARSIMAGPIMAGSMAMTATGCAVAAAFAATLAWAF